MNISVFGIGYVGAVSSACLARDGHTVLAVDVSASKVDEINAGHSPIVEKGLPELIAETRAAGRLSAGMDGAAAVMASEISLVCVGTPSLPTGALDLGFATRAAEELGAALKAKDKFHVVVFRSTMLPGSMDEVIIPALERTSGLRAGQDFGVGYYPEFLRESSAIADYDLPGAVVFGSIDERTLKAMHALQPGLKVTPHEVDLKGAEIIKYVNNAWHAAKISFSNEVGNICRAIGVDSHQVMRIVCSDTRLNISPAYMMPGFAYGGSCLPKDLRALRYRAKMLDVPTPVLDGVVAANSVQLDRAFKLVEQSGARKVGLVGLSFKADTDDLRESPLVILAETLIGKGYDLKIYDPNIRLSRLTGSNLAYVQQKMPHIAALLTESLDDVVEHAGVLVLAQKKLGVEAMASRKLGDTQVIDLIRVDPALTSRNAYEGLSW